ncbi:hypothetical protein EV196_103276 [Mariniflexile fucanivorans]|uniref:GH16 domain-containing protein n=1 Tax=Mariniflexile fucanivorans TaxID=264023 RepID=A0A4V6NGX2_9FLAO|nr:hypothetical protein [Mariniflexile fucanivorans]TCL66857.1 hypothetical protein EV196_103276 [Mariniflexile fucanivorans]
MVRNKSLKTFKAVLSLLILPSFFFAQTNESEKPPESVQSNFSLNYDSNKSDDFNSGVIDTIKWTFRTQGGARFNTIDEVNWHKGKNITFGNIDTQTGATYVSIKSAVLEKPDHDSDGLASKFSTKYGFYILKFKLSGLVTGVADRTTHNPAVWSGWKNFSDLEYRSINRDENGKLPRGTKDQEPYEWMEVDFMEVYDNVPSWKSLTLTHDKVISNDKPSRVRGKQYVIDEPDLTTSSSKWQIIGFELTPEI